MTHSVLRCSEVKQNSLIKTRMPLAQRSRGASKRHHNQTCIKSYHVYKSKERLGTETSVCTECFILSILYLKYKMLVTPQYINLSCYSEFFSDKAQLTEQRNCKSLIKNTFILCILLYKPISNWETKIVKFCPKLWTFVQDSLDNQSRYKYTDAIPLNSLVYVDGIMEVSVDMLLQYLLKQKKPRRL